MLTRGKEGRLLDYVWCSEKPGRGAVGGFPSEQLLGREYPGEHIGAETLRVWETEDEEEADQC